ncbi:hypothetical protein [Amycolatopsis sp. CA-230715]|uniref:hypothetical protein n=1 Tax=Amycolatopsis sp. CA-230715 TaxID=2745196 RepID=UPI001C02609D|nr:hypothetical protein [Amycolatopsis sp. CA-230715]QWF81219.1 hypothetical protein HUW46_04645 [Amycolatopsis sp. CA-230715]
MEKPPVSGWTLAFYAALPLAGLFVAYTGLLRPNLVQVAMGLCGTAFGARMFIVLRRRLR